MSYLSVISLDEAKDHLRIERDETDSDSEISRMIKAACIFVERYTNHHLVPKSKTYHIGSDGFLNVYDYPIEEVSSGVVSADIRPTYSRYCGNPQETFVLDVGYRLGKDVPTDIIEEVLEIIAVWFYGSEKNINTTLVPMNVKEVLDLYKRFII